MQSHHLPPLPMKNWFSLLNVSYSNMINLETRSDAHTHNPYWRISAGASNSKISLGYKVSRTAWATVWESCLKHTATTTKLKRKWSKNIRSCEFIKWLRSLHSYCDTCAHLHHTYTYMHVHVRTHTHKTDLWKSLYNTHFSLWSIAIK